MKKQPLCVLRMALVVAVVFQLAQSTSAVAVADELASPRCDYGEAHPEAAEEIEQFAFLVGDYSVVFHAWQGTKWSPPQPNRTARWNGWYGLGGMAIFDEWFDPDPGLDPNASRGVNVRMWDPKAEEWDMMWVATGANQVQDLRAKVKDGELTMWQVYPERPDFKAVFEVIDKDHWARISFNKNEKGEWQKQFKLAASRIPCED